MTIGVAKRMIMGAKNDKGQTAVEYILMLAVILLILLSVFSIIRERVLAGAENCTPEQKSLICRFHRIFSDDQFRFFRLIRFSQNTGNDL